MSYLSLLSSLAPKQTTSWGLRGTHKPIISVNYVKLHRNYLTTTLKTSNIKCLFPISKTHKSTHVGLNWVRFYSSEAENANGNEVKPKTRKSKSKKEKTDTVEAKKEKVVKKKSKKKEEEELEEEDNYTPEQLEKDKERIKNLLSEGKFDKATDIYSKMIDSVVDPWQRAQLLAERAQCYVYNKDIESAILDLDEAIETSEEDFPDAHALRCDLLYQRGDFERGLSDAETLHKMQPDSDPYMWLCATGYMGINQPEKAIPYLTMAIEANPWHRYILTRGLCYNKIGDDNNAIADLSRFIEEAPSSPDVDTAYFERARSYIKKGDMDLALSDLESAIESEKRFSSDIPLNPYLLRAAILTDLKRYDDAILDCNRIIDQQSSSSTTTITSNNNNTQIADALNHRAKIKYDIGKYDESIDDCNESLKYDDKKSDTLKIRADCYVKLSKYDNAIDDMTSAINMNPNDPLYYVGRATIYTSSNRYHDAINDFTKAIELNPDAAQPYLLRSACYSKIGNEDLAQEDLQKGFFKDPSVMEFFEQKASANDNNQ